MKSCLQIISLLLLSISISRGQDTNDTIIPSSFNVLGITIGINQIKEENLLPRVHSGFITSLSYEYRHIGEQYQDFNFTLGYSRIQAVSENLTKSANAMITSSYSYCFKVFEESFIKYFIGPQAKLAYSISFYPNWDDSHLYWGNAFSLGISNAAVCSFKNDTRLFSRLSIDFMSLSSRPDMLRLYKNDDFTFDGIVSNFHGNLKTGLLSVATSIHFDTEYQFPVFRTKTEAVFYSFDYTRIDNKNALPFTQMLHQLGLRILL